jgi:hypothetical protein
MANKYNNTTSEVDSTGEELPPAPGTQRGGESNGEAPARALSDAELTALISDSPFLDLNHPIDARETIKLSLMLPVVLLKWAALLVAVVYSWLVLLLLLVGHRKKRPMGRVRCAPP